MTMTPIITNATIVRAGRTFAEMIANGRFADEVHATFDDGTTKKLFSYFADEIQFVEPEFVGLTEAQACDLRFRRDVAYLQSGG